MGITDLSIQRINRHLPTSRNGIKMLELGAQCLYINGQLSSDKNKYWAKDYFTAQGIEHTSIDLFVDGEWAKGGRAITADLREPLDYRGFDVVTNFGTTEHVVGSLWMAFKNIHNACKTGGIMIHENPKTGNWPGHGEHYMTTDFYDKLAEYANYDLLEVTEEAAHGNTTNGWNVCAVLVKKGNTFISERKFNTLDFRTA